MNFKERWNRVMELSGELLGGGYPPGWMISQDEREAEAIYEKMVSLPTKVFVEIGSQFGGSLFLYAGACVPGATIISIDAGQMLGILNNVVRILSSQGYDMSTVIALSNQDKAIRGVDAILAGRKIDVLLIDGCHKDPVVTSDWDMYSPLVRPGGLVMFHDILEPCDAVKDVWGRIKESGKYKCEDVVFSEKMGMGVVTIPETRK